MIRQTEVYCSACFAWTVFKYVSQSVIPGHRVIHVPSDVHSRHVLL